MNYIYTLKEADCENGPFKASIDKESLVQYAKERYGLDLIATDVGEVVYLSCAEMGYLYFEIHKVPVLSPNLRNYHA